MSGFKLVKEIKRIVFGLKRILTVPLRKIEFNYYGKGVIINSPVCQIINRKCISIGAGTVIGKFARIEPIKEYAGFMYSPKIEIGKDVCINQNFHCTCAESVKIGDGTSITANCGVFDIIHPYENININPRKAKIRVIGVSIGCNCLIGMNSIIFPGTRLGNHCVVGANSTVSGIWPDYTVLVGSPVRAVKRYNLTTQKWEKTKPDGTFL